MHQNKKLEMMMMCGLLVAIFAFTFAAWVFGSYQEAKAFNNVTGKDVSTWDAMWIELRVQESSK